MDKKPKLTETDFRRNLENFTGTQEWYRHPLNRSVLYTEGAQYVAETCGAYWLLDEIALNQMLKEVKKEEFQVWKLVVDVAKSSGVLTCEDGDYHLVFEKKLDFTTFPFSGIEFFFENNTIYLPSER